MSYLDPDPFAYTIGHGGDEEERRVVVISTGEGNGERKKRRRGEMKEKGEKGKMTLL